MDENEKKHEVACELPSCKCFRFCGCEECRQARDDFDNKTGFGSTYVKTPKTIIKQKASLHGWKLVCIGDVFTLIGESPDHPKLGYGPLKTSRVIRIDFEKGEAETVNTIYSLHDERN